MMQRSTCISLLVVMTLVSGCTGNGAATYSAEANHEALFELTPALDKSAIQRLSRSPGIYPAAARLFDDPSVLEVRRISVKPSLIAADNPTLSVPIPCGAEPECREPLRFNLRRFSDTVGMSGWIGDVSSDRRQRFASSNEVLMDPLNWISLVRDADQLVGDIHAHGKLYRVEYLGAGQHVLVTVDESKMPSEAQPIMPQTGQALPTSGIQQQSSHSTIRVLMVSTNQRRALTPNYRALLVQALQDANQYMINSAVPITYELAGFYDADYDQPESYAAQLYDLSGVERPGSALAKAVYEQRDALGAHLVSMYSSAPQLCGTAYGWSTKERGYSIISCTAALAHELGHNLGGRDGWNPSPPPGNNNGYKHEASPVFHTRMVTSHGALAYFSNPRLTYQGIPIGTDRHDMAGQFDNYRHVIEGFYPRFLSYRLYEEANFQGASCSFATPLTALTPITSGCFGSGVQKVRSAIIAGLSPKNSVTFQTRPAYPKEIYVSTTFSGILEIPRFDSEDPLPEGVMRFGQGHGVSGNISAISSWKGL